MDRPDRHHPPIGVETMIEKGPMTGMPRTHDLDATDSDERHRARVPHAAYVHVPFCSHKCGYCDFASVAGQDDLQAKYLDALEREMATILEGPTSVETLFVGGGTPTYLPTPLLDRLLTRLNYWFPIEGLREFTVESNPNTLTADKVACLADHGVGRVSLGAQSFEPRLLHVLEREHDPSSVARAIEMLRSRIARVSIDLIFGVPGQTLDLWKSDLAAALALPIDHLSAYGLTYEKGTTLWRQRRLGIVQPVDDELERSLFEYAIDRLNDAGFEQYEISNYARRDPSRDLRCAHNLVYWANHAYHGFGTGAASYRHGVRALNHRNLESYISRCADGDSPIAQREELGERERAHETAMLHLRRLEGIERASFERQTGSSIDAIAGAAIRRHVELGLLSDDGRRVRLTREGLPLADGVLAAIL